MIAFEPAPAPPRAASRSQRRLAMGTAAALVIAALGGGAALSGLPAISWHSRAEATPAQPSPAIPVSVARVAQRDTTLWSEFSGRLEAVGRVEVRPQAAGAIVAVHFSEGSLVHKGDLLFTIDPAPYAAEVARLEAQVAGAQSLLELATREQARARALAPTNAIPQRELDQRVNDFHAAGSALLAAQAQLAEARLNFGYTEVRAPIDGRIGRIEVTPGNLVPAGPTAPVLTTLVSVDPIYASFDVDEPAITRALAGLSPDAKIDRIPVAMDAAASAGTPLRGVLQFVDNVVDAQSGTVRVRARFDNPDGRLRPGQFARLRLGQPQPSPEIAIDEQAIGTDQDRRYVMVVGGDNRIAYRQVTLGAMNDGLRIVTAGLKPGERIVVNGLQRVQPGALVAPRVVAMGESATAQTASD